MRLVTKNSIHQILNQFWSTSKNKKNMPKLFQKYLKSI